MFTFSTVYFPTVMNNRKGLVMM